VIAEAAAVLLLQPSLREATVTVAQNKHRLAAVQQRQPIRLNMCVPSESGTVEDVYVYSPLNVSIKIDLHVASSVLKCPNVLFEYRNLKI